MIHIASRYAVIFAFVSLSAILFHAPASHAAGLQEIEKVEAFGPIGDNLSQYSPWVMHQPGWGSYVMYYCKNSPVNGGWRDRVWRTESWTGGKTDWINDQIVIDPSAELSRNKPVTASSSYAGNPASYAVDGNTSNLWNAGATAPGWIRIDLGVEHTVDKVRMKVAQLPNGNTVHAVYFENASGVSAKVKTFSQYTSEGQWLEFTTDSISDTVKKSVRYVKIETTSSTSWIAWHEIEVWGISRSQYDGMSCSPGVVIGSDETWHMYYVTAPMESQMSLHLDHATAQNPGLTWTKQPEITLQFTDTGYFETPSPILINGSIYLYLLGPSNQLYRMISGDGFSFSTATPLTTPAPPSSGNVSHGRVSLIDGVYYYVYSVSYPIAGVLRPTEIYVATSTNGITFSNPVLVSQSSGSDWDGLNMWSPHLLKNGTEFWMYYAGNLSIAPDDWWGANTSIGLRRY